MTTTQKRWFVLGTAVLSVALLAGCSGATAPTSTTSDADAYECNGRFVDPETYADGMTADQLPEEDVEGTAVAVDDAGDGAMTDDLSSWIVAVQQDDSVTLLHPLEVEGEYDVVIFDRMDEVPATGEPGWMLTSSASCALALDPSPLTSANVALDPSAEPAADSTSVALLVTERECNSGQDAEGRIDLLSLEETTDAVIIRVGVRAQQGAFNCQSNPPTSFTVELSEPLGDRELLDGSLVIPQPIPPQPELGY
ncbi:hypothetical protein [Microbacterium sp. GXF0217]